MSHDGRVTTRATLEKDPQNIQSMFDHVAARYDVTNDVLSFGQDRLWRREVVRAVGARRGQAVLDLAAGTGTSAKPLQKNGATVVAADFSLGMLAEGRRRFPTLALVAADAMQLPFADDAFDALTISFGLRNIAEVGAALTEMRRVVRPGGRLVVCEFSRAPMRALRMVYEEYLLRALPAIARRVSSAPDAYTYLAESIRAWPEAPELAAQLVAAGWNDPAWRYLSGGIVALHRATA
jgi:demethylmenaquinone methyltransferase / 2-methoxy-6-polyprenyl-1,4-benzoquinol methylase